MYHGTPRIRQYDAGYTLERAKELSWVDSNNVFLMGLSQDGVYDYYLFVKIRKCIDEC